MSSTVRTIKFNKENSVEKELLDYLDKNPNKSKYIKDLIKTDVMKQKRSERSEIKRIPLISSNGSGEIKFEV